MIVWPAPSPSIVTLLVISSCSSYVPAAALIVCPSSVSASSRAAWIVANRSPVSTLSTGGMSPPNSTRSPPLSRLVSIQSMEVVLVCALEPTPNWTLATLALGPKRRGPHTGSASHWFSERVSLGGAAK